VDRTWLVVALARLSKGVKQTPNEYRDQLTLNLAHLVRTVGLDAIPTETENDTMLKTGNTPPSHGYILDRNGKVVSQAHGYADDHYVPFNLKHCRRPQRWVLHPVACVRWSDH
jgi:hypothetical protein